LAIRGVKVGKNTDLADLLRRVEILERAVLGPGKGAASPGDRETPKAAGSARADVFDGAVGGVRLLISKGFFNSRRSFAEVEKAMQDEGYHYSKQAVQMPLGRLSNVGGPLVALKNKGKNIYVKRK
jgi:hypothetical protein